MEGQTEQKISKYSSGVNIIIRLDLLWKDTHLHSRNGQFAKWNDDLDCIWRELARDLNDENYKKFKQEFDNYAERLKKLMPFLDSKPSGFREPTQEEIKKRAEQYNVLDEKQLFLARLENFLGKGTTEDDEDDDFD